MLHGSDASHSYAYEHIMKESHRSYTQPDASWLQITSKEIKKLIALLLHFGFVKVRGSVDRNWSTETFRHGHVTGKVKTAEGWWTAVQVPQPRANGNYNKYMNAVDQSDQILGTECGKEVHNVVENSFFIDMAVVNSSILIKENQARCSDEQPALKCTVY